ncbi:MAG TPA: alpha/beta fold hydrolase [Anaerolineales bacterium]|nr:alpha/beta fold hydrolase [Anaerolineales bacterium]
MKTHFYGFALLILLTMKACETTDPASLPNRPALFGQASSSVSVPVPPSNPSSNTSITAPLFSAGVTTALQLVPPASVPADPHPLQIDAKRSRDYPGSDITIEATLDPGESYSRYYVSYLSDGLKIYALMTVPSGPKPPTGWPVIIFNHGYIPPDVYRTTERYVRYVGDIANSGYIVFKSDYRGHDRSEGTPGGHYTRDNYTIDVLNAVASVKRHQDADPNRIGMWGHSMGGYITLRSMVISRDIKAGSIWAGVVARYPDLYTRWNAGARPTSPGPGSFIYSLEQAYGSVDTNPEFWRSISANGYLADISGPVQIHTGTADHDVPWQFSQMLYDELMAANKVGELYLYEGDNHNISNNFDVAMQRTIEFFDRYLK